MDEYLKYGYYARGIFELVSDEQLDDPKFVRGIRNYAASLNIPHERWRDYIMTWYARAPIIFKDENGREVWVDTREFEFRWADWWFRDFCKRVPDGKTPRIKGKARKRVRALASLLVAHRSLRNR